MQKSAAELVTLYAGTQRKNTGVVNCGVTQQCALTAAHETPAGGTYVAFVMHASITGCV